MRGMRGVMLVAAGCILPACGSDRGPCEEPIEAVDDLVGTWETQGVTAYHEGEEGWYPAWFEFYVMSGSRLSIGAGGQLALVGVTWDSLGVEREVTGTGTMTLSGDSVTVAWSAIDPRLVEQQDVRLEWPITFKATLRNAWPDYDDWGLFETVECRGTPDRWLELTRSGTGALLDPELDGTWDPLGVRWLLVEPGGAR